MAGVPGTWRHAPDFGSVQYDFAVRWHGVCDPLNDHLVVRDAEDGSWAAFWLRDGRVCGALQVNCEFGARAIEDLVVDWAEVDERQLADSSVPFPAVRVA